MFDTDVDRSAVVASTADPINSNKYIALMAYIALRRVSLRPPFRPPAPTVPAASCLRAPLWCITALYHVISPSAQFDFNMTVRSGH